MKFLPLTLAGLFVSSFTDAKPFKKALGKNKVLNKKKLMRGAKPYKNGKIIDRKLEGNEEFEITGAHSVQFNQCVSLKTNAEDIFDEDIYQYTYDGQIVAERSYVIFNVCQTEYCGYDAYDMQYVTDLATYIGALAEYIPNQKEQFCDACEQFDDFCNQEEEEEEEEEEEDDEEEEDEEEDDEDRKRKLAKRTSKKKKHRGLKNKGRKLDGNYINCDECWDSGCYDEDDEDNDDQVAEEDIVGWIQEIAECKESESQWGDFNLYAGFICNSYGNGVEIAVFLDDECTMYTNQQTFANIMDEDDDIYYQESSDLVTYPFTTDIDCAGEVEYDDPDEEEDENEDEDQDEEEEAEANEVCQNLFDDNTVDLDTCGNNGDEEDEEEEEEEEDDENAVNYDWYAYDIDDENAEEMAYVCKFLQEWDGEYSAVYQDTDDASGGFYDYSQNDADAEEASSASSGGNASAGKIIGIVILIAAVAIAAVFAVKAMTKSEDSKAEPLTKKSGGAMA